MLAFRIIKGRNAVLGQVSGIRPDSGIPQSLLVALCGWLQV